ncbi:MAG: 30S ribosomal protein S6 [Desulfosalsimonadaceae bacterium]
MNRYETFIIFEADLAEEERKAILERVESLISGDSGVLLIFDEWGSRKLAYPIRKKNQGYYVRADYCATGNAVASIERILSQDQRILRFMTVRLEADADAEALKAEMAAPEETTAAVEPAEDASGTDSEPAEIETAVSEDETPSTVETESESVDKE